MIGKAERGEATIKSIKKHQASYLIAVGGAAFDFKLINGFHAHFFKSDFFGFFDRFRNQISSATHCD
jgi:hypothetical protein